MSKPARGSKRVCQSCGTRFYDLGRTPIVCPSCQAVYQLTQPTSRRGERAPVPEVREKVEPEVETVALEPETISLEEVEEVGEDVAVEDEEIIDLGEDEAEIPAAGDEDTFLEEPEGDEEADVSGIVGGPGAGGKAARSGKPETRAPVSTARFAFLLNADQDRPNSSPRSRPPDCWLPAVRFPNSDRGHSSVGRAREWHSRGRRFDPAWLHQMRLSPFKASWANVGLITALDYRRGAELAASPEEPTPAKNPKPRTRPRPRQRRQRQPRPPAGSVSPRNLHKFTPRATVKSARHFGVVGNGSVAIPQRR